MEEKDEKHTKESKFPDSSSWLRLLFPEFHLFCHFHTFFSFNDVYAHVLDAVIDAAYTRHSFYLWFAN